MDHLGDRNILRVNIIGKSHMRDYLVYVSAKDGKWLVDVDETRLFDVAVNDWAGGGLRNGEEYWFQQDIEKLDAAKQLMGEQLLDYKAVAFFEDDEVLSTADINRLFETGVALGLSLWQPSVSSDSFYSWAVTLHQDTLVRKTTFVEMMCPFFSREALRVCLPHFGENLSAWGLDTHVFPGLLNYEGMAIIDAVQVKHIRPCTMGDRILKNGKTPRQEWQEIITRYERR
jgi:hypothetical protein